MIAGNALGFGYYLPEFGVAISALSGIVLWGWFFLIGRRLLQLAGAERRTSVRLPHGPRDRE
jgi:hypothetical protein